MKSSEQPAQALRRQRSQAVLDRRLAELFRRLPMLCGFSLTQDLRIADLAVHAWPGYTTGEELSERLIEALADLVDEDPEAVDLMRGRTFARAFH